MEKIGIKNPSSNLQLLGIDKVNRAFWNLTPEVLIAQSLCRGIGVLSDTGALAVSTFSIDEHEPVNAYIVLESNTKDTIHWGHQNQVFQESAYNQVEKDLLAYFQDKEVFIQDVFAGPTPATRTGFRLVTNSPATAHFFYNHFNVPKEIELLQFIPDWIVYCAPGFSALPALHDTERPQFSIINFRKKHILIGGTGHFSDLLSSIYKVLNFVLPTKKTGLPLMGAASKNNQGDVSLFLGVEHSGKTTLALDQDFQLIADNLLAWSDSGIFNLENGCYTNVSGISQKDHPKLLAAIKHRSLLENANFYYHTRKPDFNYTSENNSSRLSVPLSSLADREPSGFEAHPKHIFILVNDARGVFPLISKLTPEQAMLHFFSGYQAKPSFSSDTYEPEITFSPCFGTPPMPLPPIQYAELLKNKIQQHQPNLWLVNTGWIGGDCFNGYRIPIEYTKSVIKAASDGRLNNVPSEKHPVFGLNVPLLCPQVPFHLLQPRNTWKDKEAYDIAAKKTHQAFSDNFSDLQKQYNSSFYHPINGKTKNKAFLSGNFTKTNLGKPF